MRVTFTTAFRTGLEDINATAAALSERQRQVGSGRRVHLPSDDPAAAWGIVGERTEMRSIDSYAAATDSVDARLKVADAALSDIISALTAAQTRGASARTTVLSAVQRDAIALDLQGLRDQVLSDVNMQYRGMYLFSGSRLTTPPYVLNGAGVVQPYAGDADPMRIDLDRAESAAVTLDGSTVAQGTDPADVFQVLDTLVQDVRAGNATGIDAGLAALGRALDRASTAQSSVGHTLGRLDAHREQLLAARNASDARRSALEDANLAEAITGMQQADAAHTAALGAVAAGSRLSLLDYLK